MVRTCLAISIVIALVGTTSAQTVTFTTLGATTSTTEGATVRSLVRIVPSSDPEAKVADAALQKWIATDPHHKPGTVAFSQLFPNPDYSSVSSGWVLTALPYSTTFRPYGGYGYTGLGPYTGLTTVSPYYSTGYSLGAGAFQSTGGWPGAIAPNAAGNTTIITNNIFTNTNTYNRNTRFTPSPYSTGLGGLQHGYNPTFGYTHRR